MHCTLAWRNHAPTFNTIFAGIVGLSCLGNSCFGQNVLTNPGFEVGTNGWSVSSGTLTTNAVLPFAGIASGSAALDVNGRVVQALPISLPTNQIYTVSGFFKSPVTNQSFTLTLFYQDGPSVLNFSSEIRTVTPQWTQLSGTFNFAPTGIVSRVELWLRNGSASTPMNLEFDSLVFSPASPTLAITRVGANVEIRWPTNANAYVLQTTPVLPGGTNWSTVTNNLQTNGGFVIHTRPAISNAFFRLKL